MKIRLVILAAVALLCSGCGGNRKAERFSALPFPSVLPPAMMEEPKDRAEYMAYNYWNRITDTVALGPSDSLLVNGVRRSDVEQKFADWTSVLEMTDIGFARRSVKRLYERVARCETHDTSSALFETFTALVDKYLYDPNSPLRNEDLYGAYAECLSESPLVDADMKGVYAHQARMCALNRVGTAAADFRFADSRGRLRTLYGIDAELTLLFFSNPGCTACKEIIDVLNNDPVISRLITDGTMAVLNIYIDEDIESWRSYMSIYPENWYNGFDPDYVIRGETLYNVRAIPSLYLLDRDKVVLMKDVPETRLFDRLGKMSF